MLKELLFHSPSFKLFTEAALNHPKLLIEELWEAPKAMAIAALFFATDEDIIVFSSGHESAHLQADLSALIGDDLLELPLVDLNLPNPDLLGRAFEICSLLDQKERKKKVIFTTLAAALTPLIAPEELKSQKLTLQKGAPLSPEDLVEILLSYGYTEQKCVSDKGQFARRGGIVDLFSFQEKEPFRLIFDAEEIEVVKAFDPLSQRTTETRESAILFPKNFQKGLSLTARCKKARLIFEELLSLEESWIHLRHLGELKDQAEKLLDSHQWIALTDYLAKELHENQPRARQKEKREASIELFGKEISLPALSLPFIPLRPYLGLEMAAPREKVIAALADQPKSFDTLYLPCRSELVEKGIKKELSPYLAFLPKKLSFLSGSLSTGICCPSERWAIMPDTELGSRPVMLRAGWRKSYHTQTSDYHELTIGDLVVHYLHGIGTYLGVERGVNAAGEPSEFLLIEYAGGSRLFVPAAQSHLVSRYIGNHGGTNPEVHALGSKKWQNLKAKTESAIIGYAKDLLLAQAQREAHGGNLFPEDSELMRAFEDSFPYDETQDQLAAISAIKLEMCSSRAMDHLLCGDVGYGKTEVAMRAAFKACAEGKKQVALLVPTTLLALQHGQSFRERMEPFGIKVSVLSRLQKPKEQRLILEGVAKGEVDILIGTHRLLQDDLKFKDLGLLIIDEEQRFGVRAKEKLKKAKIGVDTLTLTATPIPRTLYLSLIKLRGLSVIAAPPQDRLPIRTIVSPKNHEVIRAALQRELARGGQVFFVHNRVESLPDVVAEISSLVPSAKTLMAHGQMDGEDLDTIFTSFREGEGDILFATSLIESGIDIPNANTIIVDRADHFGLSDLYQLRGRVGRWNRLSYAYFLTPSKMTEEARERLDALVTHCGFGGGMKLAMKDLELRGAGDILGVSQSGHLSAVGYHLYSRLLRKAVEALSRHQTIRFQETRIDCDLDARIPDSYIADSSLKLEFYHRLGEASSPVAIDQILEEMKDRFGTPPQSVFWLCEVTHLRYTLSELGFTRLKIGSHHLEAEIESTGEPIRRKLSIPSPKEPADLKTLPILLLRLFPEIKTK